MTAWESLIVRYADGRTLCNCRQAYYSEGGTYWRDGIEHHDGLYCKSGCSSNQLRAKEYIAERVMEELPDVPAEHG